jgi:hypothetical protein
LLLVVKVADQLPVVLRSNGLRDSLEFEDEGEKAQKGYIEALGVTATHGAPLVQNGHSLL